MVLQPKFVSRVGTNFGSREGTQRNIVTTRSGVRAALVRRETGRNARTDVLDTRVDEQVSVEATTSQPTVAAPTAPTSTGGSYSGGSSGGGGGGGY